MTTPRQHERKSNIECHPGDVHTAPYNSFVWHA